MQDSGSLCVSCKQWKPRTAFSASQLKKNTSSRSCSDCVNGPWQDTGPGAWVEPEAGSKRCYFCGKFKSNAGFSVNQRKKAAQGLGSCYECVEAGHWVGRDDQEVGEAPRLCGACGNWKPPEDFSRSQLKNNSDAPKCTLCVNTGREILDRFKRYEFDSRSLRPLVRPRSRSRSSSSSSTRSCKDKKKKKKKRRKRSSSSSSSSSSSRSAHAAKAEKAAPGVSAAGAEGENPDIDSAKRDVLEQLMKVKSVEPREARMREFRKLLREWHPDKNPKNKEVATAVFQFLQKGKSLVD